MRGAAIACGIVQAAGGAGGYMILFMSTDEIALRRVASELKREFDALYAESDRNRGMMSVSSQDRVAGRPPPTQVIAEFKFLAAERRKNVATGASPWNRVDKTY